MSAPPLSTAPEPVPPTTPSRPSSPGVWTVARAVAAVDLRRLARDKVALFFMLFLPFVLILALGVAFPSDAGKVRVGVVARETTGVGGKLLEAVGGADNLDVRFYDDDRAVVRDIQLGEIDAGIIIPAGLTEVVESGGTGQVRLELDPANQASAMLRNMLDAVVENQALVLTAARFAENQTGVDQQRALAAAEEQVRQLTRGQVQDRTVGGSGVPISGFAFTALSQLILFMFINSLAGGSSLVEMRTLGVADRAMTAPVSTAGLVGGITMSRFAIALGQGFLIAVVSAVAFGVDWGDPAVLVVVVTLFALVSAGAGVLMGALARTPDQAVAFGIPLALVMAALGGCFFPLSVAPPVMQVVARVLTPQAWATGALTESVFDGASLPDVAVNVVVLCGFAALYLSLGVVLLQRRLERR
jgi:ABC-2 type transport system permease protein